MKLRSARSGQRGMVALVLIALLLLGGAIFAFSSFNFTTVRVDRDRNTNEALARAKDALIAYAVADTARPGELPCPDVNNDGKITLGEDMIGSACVSLIGRLPWSTLGLPDLRDDAGERLWYALSNDFHANGTVPLNSDTAYLATNVSLTLAGTTPATNLVAIVFSPGTALRRSDGVAQTRGCTGGAGAGCDANLKCTSAPAANTDKCNAVNYLDIASGEDNANLVNRIFVSAPRSDTFNDRLMPVFSDDIMQLVERRAARQLAQHLREHFDAWENSTVVGGASKGFYPYAVPWGDPSAAAQAGTNGTTSGLLPLSTAPLTWSNATPTVCTGNGTQTLECSGLVVCILGICVPGSASAQIDNVATRFVDPPQAANFQLLGLALGGSASWTLNKPARRLDFSYSGIVVAGFLDIRVTAPATSSWVSGWLGDNNWHQNAYYAFSPGYAIDGNDSCGGPTTCFTIANMAMPNNEKQAVVVMTGRALPLASPVQDMPRLLPPPPVAAAQYLEGANAAMALAFERGARTASFNDTPIAVRP